MEMDDELGKRIRHRKFVVHNQAWWQMVTGTYDEQGDIEQHQQEQEMQYAGGPYHGYGDAVSDDEGDLDGMMMGDDGDYSMDAYGDTGYLNAGGAPYYDEDDDGL